MNNIYIKYSGICLLTAAFSFEANPANAQTTCITAPDCAAMGYTKTFADCPDASIKCPWDISKLFCSGFSEPDKTCELGDILYQDKKCYEIGKTKKAPIGIVVSPESTLAIALDANKGLIWAESSDANTGGTTDNPYIQNCQQANVPDCIGTGKQLTAAILKFGKEKGYSFPAAEYCNSYATVGTEPGEWFLPSMNEYFFVVYALRYYNIINNSLISIKRPAMGEYDGYWTSSESKANGAWLALGPAKWGLESATHWMEHGKYETEVYVRPMINYGKEDCTGVTEVSIPANAFCTSTPTSCPSKCTEWGCNEGYTRSNNSCIKEISCSDGGYLPSIPNGKKCSTIPYKGLVCYTNCKCTPITCPTPSGCSIHYGGTCNGTMKHCVPYTEDCEDSAAINFCCR